MAGDDVVVQIGAKIEDLNTGVDAVKSKLNELTAHAETLGAGFESLGRKIKEAFTVAAVVEFVNKMGELGLEAERTSAILGLSMEQTVQLGGMAKLTGTSMDSLAMSMERLYLGIQRSTRDAFSPAADAMKKLGLSMSDVTSTGGNAWKMLDLLHDRISKVNTDLNLDAALMAIGSRGIAQMIPFLHLSAEEWEKNKDAITASTQGWAAAVPEMAETHRNMTLLTLAVTNLGIAIFNALGPSINGVINLFRDLVNIIVAAGKEGGSLSDIFTLLTNAGRLVASAIAAVSAAVVGLGISVVAAGNILADFSQLKLEDAKTHAEEAATAIEKLGKSFKDNLTSIWSTPMRVDISKPSLPSVAPLNFGARDAAEAFKAQQQQIIIEAQQTLARQKLLYDLDVTNFSMTQQQKYDMTITATQQAEAIELAALTRIRDQYKAHSKDWEEAEKARIQATEKANTEILKLTIESYKALRSEVGGYVDSFSASWNSHLKDMLTGTKTVTQSIGLAFGDMIIYMIEQLEKKFIFEKLTTALTQALYVEDVTAKTAAETAKTGVAAAGEAQRAGIQATGLTTSIATYVSDAFAAIGASLAKLFASLSAFFAFLGPAAPAAAMAVVAGVGVAAYGMIKGFEVGTDYVPYTGLAMVHQGERIIPASQNVPGAMGTTTLAASFSIQAWDARSVQTWLINGGDKQIASAISKLMNRNPSARPSY